MGILSVIASPALANCSYQKIDEGTTDAVDKLMCTEDNMHMLSIEYGELNGLTLYYDIRAIAPDNSKRKTISGDMDIVIDDYESHIMPVKIMWTNDLTLSLITQEPEDILSIIKELKKAHKQIVLMAATEKSQDYKVFGVKGSSKAVDQFLKNTGLKL